MEGCEMKGKEENMKKIFISVNCFTVPILTLLIFVSFVSLASGETYQSFFGFSINIPPHWLVMSGEEIKKNPDLFDFDKGPFKNADKNFLQQIKTQVTQGKLEFYFNKNTSDNYFSDSINVNKEIGQIPQSNSEMKKECDNLPSQFAKMFGKPITFYSCGLRKISGLNAVYLEYDGILENTRGIAYVIQFTQNVTITFTLTCKNKIVNEMRKEFDDIIATVKMKENAFIQQKMVVRKNESNPGVAPTQQERVSPASEYYDRGREFFKKGQYDRAIENFTVALSMDIDPSYSTYVNRGCCYLEIKQHNKAIKDFKQAISLSPNDAKPYGWCGVAFYEKAIYFEAIRYFDKAIELEPNSAIYYLNRGHSYKKMGRQSLAVSDFKKACDLGEEDGCKQVRVLGYR
jgi:tetratricopeptide (TPR) repeat protein